MKEIIEELKIMNDNISNILEVMKKQQKSKTEQIIDIMCAAVGILSILTLIDIVINWIIGG